MDYSYYGNISSQLTVRYQFDDIANVLTNKLRQFRKQSFEPNQFYLFGYGFGGQLVIHASRKLGRRIVNQIDCRYIIGLNYNPILTSKFSYI